MRKFRKKPIEIEAAQYVEEGTLVKGMCTGCAVGGGVEFPHVHTIHAGQFVGIEVGDWVIPEPNGEHYYPCKSDIFESIYDEVIFEGDAP